MWHFRCKKCPNRSEQDCQACEVKRFIDDCRAAIELLDWYQHEYHEADFGHEEMMAELRSLAEEAFRTRRVTEIQRKIFEEIEARVDRWLYQLI
jgi:hypothetical protein